MVFWALNMPFLAFEGRLMVFKICVGSVPLCTYIYCREKTMCGLRSITRSWLEKTVLLWNWNDLGSWSSGTKVAQMQDLLLRGQKNLLRHRSEQSLVGVPQGKTHSGTFCYKLFSPMQYTIYSASTLIFFPHDWLIGRVLCTYNCWGLECTILITVHSLEAVESCSWHIINSQFYILLALP